MGYLKDGGIICRFVKLVIHTSSVVLQVPSGPAEGERFIAEGPCPPALPRKISVSKHAPAGASTSCDPRLLYASEKLPKAHLCRRA